MTTILICLFIATIMPILAKAPLALAMNKEKGGYNNRNPREQQDKLVGFGARAKAAHENSFEALIMFTPGALAIIATNSTSSMAEYFAMAFVAARIAYLLAYWFDLHVIRSAFWGIGFFASLGLLWLAIL
ncbi:MAG: putative MAPEG superfamily protein [Paraglaciecola sp.]|jgi:uncharacterized MAPEG superfamily protein